MTKKEYKQKLIAQKLIGLGMLLLCVIAILVASAGITPEDKDISVVILFAPIAIYMLVTKKIIIC